MPRSPFLMATSSPRLLHWNLRPLSCLGLLVSWEVNQSWDKGPRCNPGSHSIYAHHTPLLLTFEALERRFCLFVSLCLYSHLHGTFILFSRDSFVLLIIFYVFFVRERKRLPFSLVGTVRAWKANVLCYE